MNFEEKALNILAQYKNDEKKLDALYQWATNRTSGTAIKNKYGPNHHSIKSNLKLRYGLTDKRAEEMYANFVADIESAGFKFDTGYLEVSKDIEQYFDQDHLLRDAVLGRLKTAPQDVQYIAWLFSKTKGAFFASLDDREQIGNFAALLGATFNIQITSGHQVIEPLIKLGFLNETCWTSVRGIRHDDILPAKYLEPLVVDIDRHVSLPELPNFRTYIDAVFERRRVTVLVGLEELFKRKSITAADIIGEIIPQPYLIGKCGSVFAINPRIRTEMESYFFEKKHAISPIQDSIQQILDQLKKKYYPDIDVKTIDLFPGTFAWEMNTSDKALSEKNIMIILAPWLTKDQIEGLRKEYSSKFVAIVSTMMGIPELNDAFRKVYGTDIQGVDWVVADTTRVPFVERAAVVKPQLLSELFNMLGIQQITPPIQPPVMPPQPQNVPLPPIAPTTPNSRQELLKCFEAGYVVPRVDRQWLKKLETVLHDILSELGIECVVNSNEFQEGPRLIRANVKLGKGLRINKVTQAAEDIANKLFANRELFHFSNDDDVPKHVRIESVPAKGMVGIYVPRDDFQAIPIGALLSKLPPENPLSFVVGVNVIGEPQFSNLDSMPHLLVAGQPGAGKSVFLNTMIVSLAFQNEPSRLQFILIDPKGGLEFGPYETLPHVYEGKIIRNSDEAVDALNAAREEMDRRYNLMSKESTKGNIVRSVKEYNNLTGVIPLPYRVIIADEFGSLVLSKKGKDIVELAQDIAQKGRAAGIHMVICIQRPSVNMIPGDIRAVIPSRLSFRVATGMDSKLILDEPGAEDLFGKGDMFLKETIHPELRRYQGALVTNEEIQQFAIAARSFWSGRRNWV